MIKPMNEIVALLLGLMVLAAGALTWYRIESDGAMPETAIAVAQKAVADTDGSNASSPDTDEGQPDTGSSERQQYQRAYRLIDAAAKKHDVDPALAHAIALQGSFYNPKKVSSEGAIGLMQVRPGVAAGYGLADQNKLFDPEINVEIALRHLRALLAEHDIPGALFAYTTGRKLPKGEEADAAPVSSLAQRILKQYHLNAGG